MQGIFRKENTDKALKYGIYRHLPTYEKIIRNLVSFLSKNRLNRIRNYISKFNEFEEFILHLNEILDNFSFGMPADKFEASLKEIGEMLGYKSQRQDQERS